MAKYRIVKYENGKYYYLQRKFWFSNKWFHVDYYFDYEEALIAAIRRDTSFANIAKLVESEGEKTACSPEAKHAENEEVS